MDKPKDGVKYDDGKLRWSLVPGSPMREVVRVLMHGATKYDDHNWRKVSNYRERYYNAARRHIDDWWEHELIDPESGCHHLAHAMCCLLFLMGKEEEMFGCEITDRDIAEAFHFDLVGGLFDECNRKVKT